MRKEEADGPGQPKTRRSGRPLVPGEPLSHRPAPSTQTTVRAGAHVRGEREALSADGRAALEPQDGALAASGAASWGWGASLPFRLGLSLGQKSRILSSSRYKSTATHSLGVFCTRVTAQNHPVTPAWLPPCSGPRVHGRGQSLAPGNLSPVVGFSRKGAAVSACTRAPEQPQVPAGTLRGRRCSDDLPPSGPPLRGLSEQSCGRRALPTRAVGSQGATPVPTLCPAVEEGTLARDPAGHPPSRGTGTGPAPRWPAAREPQ